MRPLAAFISLSLSAITCTACSRPSERARSEDLYVTRYSQAAATVDRTAQLTELESQDIKKTKQNIRSVVSQLRDVTQRTEQLASGPAFHPRISPPKPPKPPE